MLYKAHIAGGIIGCALTLEPVLSKFNSSLISVESLAYISGCLLGSFFPDIDEKESTITKKTGSKIYWFFRHRGVFHYPLIQIVIFLLLNPWLLVNELIVLSIFYHGFLMGLMTHYILDTPEGVRWLFPLLRRCSLKMSPSKYRIGFSRKIKNLGIDIIGLTIFFIVTTNILLR